MTTRAHAFRASTNITGQPRCAQKGGERGRANANATRTFIRPARDNNLRLRVKLLPKLHPVKVPDRLPQPRPTLGGGVVVAVGRAESLLGTRSRPLGRGKVHVALPEVDAVWREVRGTAKVYVCMERFADGSKRRYSLENRPDVERERTAVLKTRSEREDGWRPRGRRTGWLLLAVCMRRAEDPDGGDGATK